MSQNYIDSEGVKIWTFDSGQGIPVMLCNGGPGCCDYLGPVADLIDDKAHVIRFEQRGCGRSAAIPPYDVETCVKDLENIRQFFNLDCWIIGGHSWGAELALAYALQHPTKVLGLICIAGGRINNDREWHKEYRRRKDEEGEELPLFEYPPNLEVNEQVNTSWRRAIQRGDLLHAFSQLEIPTIFIYGDNDIRPSWPVVQLANLMPKASFVNVVGGYHYIWFTHSEQLKIHLGEFINGIVEAQKL